MPEKLALRCGCCERKLRIARGAAGKEGSCPRCGARIRIPTLAQVQQALPGRASCPVLERPGLAVDFNLDALLDAKSHQSNDDTVEMPALDPLLAKRSAGSLDDLLGGAQVDYGEHDAPPADDAPYELPPPVDERAPLFAEETRPAPPPREPAPLIIDRDTPAGQASRLLGRTLSGKYELLELLGQGGMGAVFLARHVGLDRRCAVKVLASRYGSERELVERFRREARATAQLAHPNVVAVFDVDEDAGEQYLAMEFIEGENVQTLVAREGALDWQRAARLIVQAASGLTAAHSRGIVHRDIKPANLMVTPEGKVKVTDFGLAQLHNAGSQLSEAGDLIGTLHYMAPEQARGEALDRRADIYALGATLYFMLSGRTPHQASSPHTLLLKTLEETPPPIRELVRIPEALAVVVEGMMARQPQDRYALGDEVVRDLQALLDDDPAASAWGRRPARVPSARRSTVGPALPTPETGRRWARALTLLVAAVAIALAGAAAGALWAGRAAERDYRQLVERLESDAPRADKLAACAAFLRGHPTSALAELVTLRLQRFEQQREAELALARLELELERRRSAGDDDGRRAAIDAYRRRWLEVAPRLAERALALSRDAD